MTLTFWPCTTTIQHTAISAWFNSPHYSEYNNLPITYDSDLIFPFCRLSSTNSLFIISSVREWNKLDNSVRNLDTPLKFKRALLSKRNEINIVPKHFMYGSRKLNVILTQLRCSTSFLNNDWFKSNIVSSPNCACIVAREDAFHFFFECSKYTDIRRDLLICVNLFRMKIDLALLTRANQRGKSYVWTRWSCWIYIIYKFIQWGIV
jgi:hypothetical protein